MSKFVRKKDDLETEGLKLFKKLRSMNIQVKMVRMDNAGENKSLQKTLEREEFNIDFQYTAAGTPQIRNQEPLLEALRPLHPSTR